MLMLANPLIIFANVVSIMLYTVSTCEQPGFLYYIFLFLAKDDLVLINNDILKHLTLLLYASPCLHLRYPTQGTEGTEVCQSLPYLLYLYTQSACPVATRFKKNYALKFIFNVYQIWNHIMQHTLKQEYLQYWKELLGYFRKQSFLLSID